MEGKSISRQRVIKKDKQRFMFCRRQTNKKTIPIHHAKKISLKIKK